MTWSGRDAPVACGLLRPTWAVDRCEESDDGMKTNPIHKAVQNLSTCVSRAPVWISG